MQASSGRKDEASFRDYAAEARGCVPEFYRENHARQTLGFVLEKKAQYLPLRTRRMGVWEAFEALAGLVDDSDPDLELPQIDHALQTAEALRADGAAPAMVLTGLLHDLGKVLCLFGEPQWAVVGDTFPVGCAFSDRIVYARFFDANPDAGDPRLSSRLGIYAEGCGLENVHFSWGHDEYLYHVLRPHLPPDCLDAIRFHSFYAGHREGAYAHLQGPRDAARLATVRAFNPYDLYSKSPERPDFAKLRPFYEGLAAELLPPVLQW